MARNWQAQPKQRLSLNLRPLRTQTHNFDVTDGAPRRFERHHVGRRAGRKPTQCSTADMSTEVWSSFGAI